jgi:glucose-1-phosphate cytidylyltransferase
MKVVILCGGQGTRLREETEYRPKPMVEVGGKPILWHIMKIYAHYGFREFILCLGYRGNIIKEYFLNYEAMNNDFTICLGRESHLDFNGQHEEQDFRVTLVDTGLHSMTGGRIKRIQKYISEDSFMVTYGDGLADIDIPSLLACHERQGTIATVTTVRPPSRFGSVELDESSLVRRFAEKPTTNDRVSAGFLVFRSEIFDYLSGDDCILERQPMETLSKEGQLGAYQHEGFFFAMDTYREYMILNDLWSTNSAPWKIWQCNH